MGTTEIIALLIAERDRLNGAIAALQGEPVQRGRLVKGSVSVPVAKTVRLRKTRTAAQKKAQSEKMRAYWAAKKAIKKAKK